MQPDETQAKKLVVLGLALLLILFLQPRIRNGVARSAEETGTIIENFTLYSYDEKKGEELTWKLSGQKARQEESGLTVRDFQLTIEVPKTGKKRETSRLSGKVLKLKNGDGERVAYMPGKIKIEIGDKADGTAREVRYFFTESRVSGKEIELKRTRDPGRIDLDGTEFNYAPKSGEIELLKGFKILSGGSGKGETKITGEKLNWPSGGRIEMTGGVTASLSSGWRLKANRLVWDTDKGLLQSSGSTSAIREGTTVSGESITYKSEKEKLVVVNGRITKEEG